MGTHPRKKRLLTFINTLKEQKDIEYGFNLMELDGKCLDSYAECNIEDLSLFSCNWVEIGKVELFSYNVNDDDPDAYTVIFEF
ncbi:MAG: hypothetical protein LBQ22_08115 [Bacteroidales bacterium]|jgi:hypothetical protein|nr:hypothetical protein [Bacteroidales bacterium]